VGPLGEELAPPAEVPGSRAREGERPGALRVTDTDDLTDDPAHRRTHDVSRAVAGVIERGDRVRRHDLEVVGAVGAAGTADATVVHHHEPEPIPERPLLARPPA